MGTKICPNCNGLAKIKYEQKFDSIFVYLKCPNCKLKKFIGLTTKNALKLEIREKKLREALERAKTPNAKSQILRRLNQIRHEKYVKQLGM